MNKKKINIFLILIIFFLFIWLKIENNKEKNITNIEYKAQNVNLNISYEENNKKTEEQYTKENIISEYKGYEVIAKLEIPEIKLETYVLKTYSKEALNVSVVKFWGVNPNTTGNFCVAGHNFKKENMFYNLKELEIGKKLYIIDNTFGKIEYEIYDMYIVLPEDVSCLSQETKGKKEVTLITCTNDSSKRIIVKAKEKE